MKKMIQKIMRIYRLLAQALCLIVVAICGSVNAKAQLYVSPGSTFYIPAGDFIVTDSLVLAPDNNLTLTDAYLHATDTAIEGPDGPSINRVYRFGNTIPFTGFVGFYFNDGELNGNVKNNLRLFYNGEDTVTYLTEASTIMPGTQDLIATEFSTSTPLNIITCADSGKRLPVKGVYFSNITATSMQVHFPEGDGVGRIVLMRPISPALDLPLDGALYTAGSALGSGDMVGNSYVVYVGNDDTVTVTNLQSNRRYHVAVYEYATGYDYADVADVKRGSATTKIGYVTLKLLGREHLQNLDSFRNGWMPGGWYTDEVYQANDDAVNTAPGVYSFGNSGSTERSLGSINPASVYGVSYRNTSGKVLTSLLLQYTGEQWSKGGSSTPGNEDAIQVSYSVNATSLHNGTWSAANNLEFKSVQTGAGATLLNGNLPANQKAIIGSVSGFNIPPGGTIWIRFTDTDLPGNDDVLAIDNVIAVPFENTYAGSSNIATGILNDLNVVGAGVTATGSVTVRYGMNLEEGSQLAFGNGRIVMNGKLYGAGKMSAGVGGRLMIGGNDLNQQIRFSSSGNLIDRLVVREGASATLVSPLRITPKGYVQIGSYEEDEAGTLYSNGNLTFTSNATGTASLAKSKGSIVGTVVSERYLYADAPPNNTLNWRWLSHPFTSGITPTDLQDDLPGMSFAPGSGNVYKYDETTANTSIITNLNTDATQVSLASEPWPTGKAMRFEKPAAATTVDAEGQVSIGTVGLTLNKGAQTDFVMAGNPLLSSVRMKTIHYAAVSAGDIANVLYVWEPKMGASGAFVTYPAYKISGFRLSPWGSYVVKMIAPTAELSFSEANKLVTTTANAFFKETDEAEEEENTEAVPEGVVQLQLYQGSQLQDEVYEMFSPANTTVHEKDIDLLKLANPNLNLYALSDDGIHLAGDARPFETGKTIQLGLKTGMKGRFTFKVGDFNLPVGSELYLVDKKGEEQLLTGASTYSFNLDANDATDRFYLRMGAGAEGVSTTGNYAQLLPNPATDIVHIRVHTQAGDAAIIKIFSATGALVHTAEMLNTAHGELTVPVSQLAAGVYNVEIMTEGGYRMIRQLIKR